MIKVELECRYCGHKSVKELYNKNYIEDEVCDKCKDGNLTVRDFTKSVIDTYKGCPKFPKT